MSTRLSFLPALSAMPADRASGRGALPPRGLGAAIVLGGGPVFVDVLFMFGILRFEGGSGR